MVWYSHLFQNFAQFIVTHTVKDFGIVNKAEIDVFLELSCFFHYPADVGNLISGSSAFSKTRNFCFIDYAKAFDCVDHNKLESSSRDGNIRPPDLPLEKLLC